MKKLLSIIAIIATLLPATTWAQFNVNQGGTGVSTIGNGLVRGNGTADISVVTTSAGISGLLSDETGTGVSVFNILPTLQGINITADSVLEDTAIFNFDDQSVLRFSELDANGSNYKALRAPASVTTNTTCTFEDDANFIPDSCVGDGTDGGTTLTDSASLAGALSDETGTGLAVFNTLPTFAGLLSGNGSTGAGFIRWLEDTDNGSNYIELISPSAITSNVQCVLENDSNPIPDSCVGDGTDGGGGGSVTFDAIEDPTTDGSIDFTSFTSIFQTALDGGDFFSITSSVSDLTSPTALISLKMRDNGDSDGIFIEAIDDISGTPNMVFSVGADGVITSDAGGTFGGALLPATNNTHALGNSSLYWSDLFLGDAAVIDFNSDVTFTHGADKVTVRGGTFIANENLSVGDANTGSGILKILEDTDSGSNFASFQVPALAANTVYVLPADDGDSGEQLQTDGSGNLTWEAAGSGGGSGDITSVGDVASGAAFDGTQGTILTFNDAGGDATLEYDNTNNWFEISSIFNPATDDGATLGNATQRWSDLFLAEGGVINWDNGDATLTQTSNDITFGGISTFGLGTSTAVTLGTIEVGAASDTTIARTSAGQITIEGVQASTASNTLTLSNKTIAAASNVLDEPFCKDVTDEYSNLTTGDKINFRMPFAMTLTAIRGSLVTAGTGATLVKFDVEENNTTIFSTEPTFDASETTTTTAATAGVISDTSLADDAVVTLEITAIGNTTPGNGLKICFYGTI